MYFLIGGNKLNQYTDRATFYLLARPLIMVVRVLGELENSCALNALGIFSGLRTNGVD